MIRDCSQLAEAHACSRLAQTPSVHSHMSKHMCTRAQVRVWGGGKQHFIGSFTSETEAARAYDKAVLRLRGQVRVLACAAPASWPVCVDVWFRYAKNQTSPTSQWSRPLGMRRVLCLQVCI